MTIICLNATTFCNNCLYLHCKPKNQRKYNGTENKNMRLLGRVVGPIRRERRAADQPQCVIRHDHYPHQHLPIRTANRQEVHRILQTGRHRGDNQTHRITGHHADMKAISNADYACLLRVLRELNKIKAETTKQKNAARLAGVLAKKLERRKSSWKS